MSHVASTRHNSLTKRSAINFGVKTIQPYGGRPIPVVPSQKTATLDKKKCGC